MRSSLRKSALIANKDPPAPPIPGAGGFDVLFNNDMLQAPTGGSAMIITSSIIEQFRKYLIESEKSDNTISNTKTSKIT